MNAIFVLPSSSSSSSFFSSLYYECGLLTHSHTHIVPQLMIHVTQLLSAFSLSHPFFFSIYTSPLDVIASVHTSSSSSRSVYDMLTCATLSPYRTRRSCLVDREAARWTEHTRPEQQSEKWHWNPHFGTLMSSILVSRYYSGMDWLLLLLLFSSSPLVPSAPTMFILARSSSSHPLAPCHLPISFSLHPSCRKPIRLHRQRVNFPSGE